MKLRPWVLTGASTVIAITALGVVVTTSEPATAQPVLFWIFWTALSIALWGFWSTILLWCRLSLARSVWIGLALTVLGIGAIVARHILH